MHFYYLDESGCTGQNLNDPEQPIFVLGGVSVRDEGWNLTQQALTGLLDNYFGGHTPHGFELHAEDLLSPNGNGAFAGHPREARNGLALGILGLLAQRAHHVHAIAFDKQRLSETECGVVMTYNPNVPYLLGFDYMTTYINWYVRERLGTSARGMIIMDIKDEFAGSVEQIIHQRRFTGPAARRIKHIVEFAYPVDSFKNPMIQLSDVVTFCYRKFLELEGGYRDGWAADAKQFYAQCFALIDARIARKQLVLRQEANLPPLDEFLGIVRATPGAQWRQHYEI
jgi:uncharacterized protein DUF3800